jgi:hypothetical protein
MQKTNGKNKNVPDEERLNYEFGRIQTLYA